MSDSEAYLRILYELPVINGTNLEAPSVSPDITVSRVLRLFMENNIGALIARANILSGLILNEHTFNGNEAYAISSQGKLSYHIYPIIGKSSKSFTKEFEYRLQDNPQTQT